MNPARPLTDDSQPHLDNARSQRGELAADVGHGLTHTPKAVPPRYFYDALGSRLFDAICELPWYPVTCAERSLIEQHATAMITPPGKGAYAMLAELGCGNGEKLALLAAALPLVPSAAVHLIDVSATALALTRNALAALRHLEVTEHCATYEQGLRSALAARRGSGPALILFLGSNIGNFDRDHAQQFLQSLRAALRPGDALLLGTDLVKPEAVLLDAYDDPLGVTAAFNKNLLVRINRELDAEFDLARFAHRAVWNAAESRVEMHLVSRGAQRIALRSLDLVVDFADGESIWTESSYKFTVDSVGELARSCGFSCSRQWLDAARGFAVNLLTAAP